MTTKNKVKKIVLDEPEERGSFANRNSTALANLDMVMVGDEFGLDSFDARLHFGEVLATHAATGDLFIIC